MRKENSKNKGREIGKGEGKMVEKGGDVTTDRGMVSTDTPIYITAVKGKPKGRGNGEKGERRNGEEREKMRRCRWSVLRSPHGWSKKVARKETKITKIKIKTLNEKGWYKSVMPQLSVYFFNNLISYQNFHHKF